MSSLALGGQGYLALQAFEEAGRMTAGSAAQTLHLLSSLFGITPSGRVLADIFAANAKVVQRAAQDYPVRPMDITHTLIDGQKVAVRDVLVAELPYCEVRHLQRGTERHDPRILFLPPYSGHGVSLTRPTIESMLPHHDVMYVSYANVRDYARPENCPSLTWDLAIDNLTRAKQLAGTETHVFSLCQPCPIDIMSSAVMAENGDPSLPISSTYMNGPIDVEAADNILTDLVRRVPPYLMESLFQRVPSGFKGAGQEVHMGPVHLAGFVGLGPQKFANELLEYWLSAFRGDAAAMQKFERNDDQMRAVLDMPASYIRDTLEHFRHNRLANGEAVYRGRLVDPRLYRNPVLTIAGTDDYLCPPLVTEGVHRLVGTPENDRRAVRYDGGHYGFAGRLWRNQLYAQFASFVREAAGNKGVTYSPAPYAEIPGPWIRNTQGIMPAKAPGLH